MKYQLFYIELPDNTCELNSIPSFTKDIWELFLMNKSAIESVIEIKPNKNIFKIFFRQSNSEIVRLGPMMSLSENDLDRIKYLSYYAGHLNIFYQTSDNEFLQSLINLYKYKGNMLRIEEDLGLTESALDLINSVMYPDVLISFAHDGNPICVFGVEKKLREIEASLAKVPKRDYSIK